MRLTARGLGRFRSGHPWIYRGDVAAVGARVQGGSVVPLTGPRAELLGHAFYSSTSLITLRVVHRGPAAPEGAFWAARLDAALALREELFPGQRTLRLVHGESDGLPSFVADRYGDVLVVQAHSQAAERLLESWVEHLAERLAPVGVLARNDARVRELEGLPREVRLVRGEVPKNVEAEFDGLRLRLDLWMGQKTGAFLDQRENYRAAEGYARGRVLDAFAFQGGFALHAARRAQSVEAVEISALAVRRGEENARLNGLERVRFVEANAFDRLHQADATGERFDMVILDPPAFAKNRGAVDAALRGYKEINLRAMRVLEPEGVLVTCSCSHHVDEPLFLEVLRHAAADAGRSCRILERRGAARDHPVLATCPETGYLKCVVARVG
ncbi:MAG: class I SAM-dependent rRNA methyltransferase [Gemmatimonadota bacterium]